MVRKSEKNCLKVTLAWHVRDVPTDGERERRERSCKTKDILFPRRFTSCHQTTRHNNAKYSRAFRWHHWSIVRVRFGEVWIFMMLIYWVAIGARTANKLSPPCLKGNALPILKTLSCSLGLRWQVQLHRAAGSSCKGQAACLHEADRLRNLRTGEKFLFVLSVFIMNILNCY